MSDLYLIAHRVRGEPAFDIACMLDQVDEDGDMIWIIPTSGHRAYPWWYIAMDNIDDCWDMNIPSMPEDLQDHYHLEAPRTNRPNLLARLNLHRTLPPIVRRI